MKIVFLDIDGVLNDPGCFTGQCAVIKPSCVNLFNKLIIETNAKVVISSSWRYMVYGGSMTEKGLEYLLKSHGLKFDFAGITAKDEEVSGGRGNQCLDWLKRHKEVTGHVVIDDDDYDFTNLSNLNFVKTNGATGISEEDVKKAIFLLGKT